MRVPRKDDTVANREIGDAGTEFGDFTGGFMAEHGGQAHRECTFDRLEVSVAETGSADADQNVAWSDRADLDRLDGHWRCDLPQDRGARFRHVRLPCPAV
jgi:hypothetical protein